MTVLGAMFGEDADVHDSLMTGVRVSLARSLRDMLDFETAWSIAMRETDATNMHSPLGHESVLEFARPRFERAYYGLDPSIPVCQAVHVCAERQVRNGACDFHQQGPHVAEYLDEQQEAMVV